MPSYFKKVSVERTQLSKLLEIPSKITAAYSTERFTAAAGEPVPGYVVLITPSTSCLALVAIRLDRLNF